ncbi:hypothetical protein AGDE_13124 [Angomonas deanei]|nr:hypothetical protein AGDE_13124 [Angomonas deanei]|eukprot:EPY22779.1 hypothetical protein AGDE_13124 [Angomonas deanei]
MIRFGFRSGNAVKILPARFLFPMTSRMASPSPVWHTSTLYTPARHGASVTRNKRKKGVSKKGKTTNKIRPADHITHNAVLFDGEAEDEEVETREVLETLQETEDIINEGYEDPDHQSGKNGLEGIEEGEEDAVERQDRTLKEMVAEENPTVFNNEKEEGETDTFQSKYLKDCFPELALEYDKSNEKDVEDVFIDDPAIAAWKCPKCTHVWRCGIFVRCALKNGCPTCYASSHPTIAQKRPDLALLYDRSKNNPFETPETLEVGSRKLVFWRCAQCSQSYQARVKDRCAEKSKCPSCSLTTLQSHNDLRHEENTLLQEWHPLKNGDLRLDQIQPTDYKTKIWWLCTTCGHDWEASVATRLSRRGSAKGKKCPVCSAKAKAEN